ncbi:helix-turn-helix domain-containing protein [Sphingosinicella terrae]|uniref:helix-turn-helix domain-containing protein n=1 Tax=Sphingosinicella terrae TaxID=2172047 RepID=UPI000E0D56E5|nr:helix-turn-helix transcriptional regulator [Sphingosinicella terrae]
MKYPSVQLAFGTRVRELRRNQGLSQEAFAALANLDRGAFGKIERGEINVGLISMARIAVALGMSLSALLDTVELEHDEVRSMPRSLRGPKSLSSGKAL